MCQESHEYWSTVKPVIRKIAIAIEVETGRATPLHLRSQELLIGGGVWSKVSEVLDSRIESFSRYFLSSSDIEEVLQVLTPFVATLEDADELAVSEVARLEDFLKDALSRNVGVYLSL